jgi:hypothetical protein
MKLIVTIICFIVCCLTYSTYADNLIHINSVYVVSSLDNNNETNGGNYYYYQENNETKFNVTNTTDDDSFGDDATFEPTMMPISDPVTDDIFGDDDAFKGGSMSSSYDYEDEDDYEEVETDATDEPTDEPTLHPTQAVGKPTLEKTSDPSLAPTPVPTTATPTSVPTSMPSYSPAPLIESITVTGQTNLSISVDVTLVESDAYVYCAPFKDITGVTVNDVIRRNLFSKSSFSTASIELVGLIPATSYTIICATVSDKGVPMVQPDEVVEVTQATDCCKEIHVKVKYPNVIEGSSTLGAAIINVRYPPSEDDLTLSVVMDSPSDGTLYPASVVRSHLVEKSTSYEFVFVASVTAGTDKAFTVVPSGTSAVEYSVVYGNNRDSFNIISADTEPPLPVYNQAIFSSDGSIVTLTFDARTDKGLQDTIFDCQDLLEFSGKADATCEWSVDGSQIYIYLPSTSTLTPGDPIDTVANKIKAFCTSTNADDCRDVWASVQVVTVNIDAPVDSMKPVVVISAPKVVGGCDSLAFDLSSSLNNGGRAWSSKSFSVSGATGASAMTTDLNNNYVFSPPYALPKSHFQNGGTFDVSITLCNFLNECGTAMHAFSVSSSTKIPTAIILGEQLLVTKRSQPVVIGSVASVPTAACDGTTTELGLSYGWEVKLNGVVQESIVSVSKQSSVFKLNPFTLATNTQYEVVLTVREESGENSKVSSQVYVESSDLVAIVSGASEVSIRSQKTLSIDGSTSLDQDVQTLIGQAAGLTYAWSCEQIKPVYSPTCPLPNFVSSNTEVLTIESNNDAIGDTSRVTLTVSDSTRSSSSYILVESVAATAPVLSVTTKTIDLLDFNVNKILSIVGKVEEIEADCASEWKMNDMAITNALTPVTSSLAAGSVFYPSLNLPENSLMVRSTYSFSLGCTAGGTTTMTKVTVTTNGGPINGMFYVSPSTGTELTTEFTFSTDYWSDPNLPIMYEFGYISGSASAIIQSKSKLMYGVVTLPAGPTANSNLLECKVIAYDYLGATSSRTTSVTVIRVSAAVAAAAIDAALAESLTSVDGTKAALANAAAVLNFVSCANAPICGDLNRIGCELTSETCGICKSSFEGEAGDANSRCANPNAVIPLTCSTNDDCTLFEECNVGSGDCEVKSKDCSVNCDTNNAICAFSKTATGAILGDCKADDPTCNSFCSCSDGFFGEFCTVSQADLDAAKALREKLIESLVTLTTMEDADASTVTAWGDSVGSLVSNPTELTADSTGDTLNVVDAILQNAADVEVLYKNLLAVVDAGEASNIVAKTIESSRRKLASKRELMMTRNLAEVAIDSNVGAIMAPNIDALIDFGTLTGSQMYPGQANVETIRSTYRCFTSSLDLVSGVISTGTSLPKSYVEDVAGIETDKVYLKSSTLSNIKVTAISSSPLSFGNINAKMYSNVVTMNLDATGVTNSDAEVTIDLKHISSETFGVDNSPGDDDFVTNCDGSALTESYTCSASGAVLTHTCPTSGVTTGTLTSVCPTYVKEPSCDMVILATADVAPSACERVSFSATETKCKCTSLTAARRKLNAASADSISFNLVANEMFVPAAVTDPVEDFPTSEPESGGGAIIIIIIAIVVVLAIGGLVVVKNKSPLSDSKIYTDENEVNDSIEKNVAIGAGEKYIEDVESGQQNDVTIN